MAEQPPSTPVQTSAPTVVLEPPDPFERLHKMSTTAGVGAGDYVAISGTAVAAVLLGLATATVLFGNPFLLAVPVAGVAVAILALVRIHQSNGTLSGRGLAFAGLLLSLGLGGYQGGRTAQAWSRNRSAESQVVALVRDFGSDVATGRFAQAYDRCDADFRGQVALPTFTALWQSVREHGTLGTLVGVDWNGRLQFGSDLTRDEPIASGMVFVKFDKSPEPARTDMFFRQVDGRWMVDRIPQFFPPSDAQGKAGGPSTGTPRATARQLRTGPLGPPKPTP